MTDEVGQKFKEESPMADECSMNFAGKQTRTSNVSGQESTRKSPTTKVTDGIFYLSASDGGLNALSSDGWHELEVTVDSGACDTVIPLGVIDHVQLHDSPGSLRNQAYEAANGSSIYNVGERRCVVGTSWESPPKIMHFQVADVKKPLLSITRVADMGFECVLGRRGGYLLDTQSGEHIPIQRKGSLYAMSLWVRDSRDFVRQE